MKAKIITLCGIDGTGKTTQLNILDNFLTSKGFKTYKTSLVTRNSNFFKNIETIMNNIDNKTYCELIAFERFRSLNILVEQEAHKFDYLLLDRYLFTDLAYSKAYNVKSNLIYELFKKSLKPDLSIILNVDVEVALKRIAKRGNKWEFQENYKILREASNEYKNIARDNCLVSIDTTSITKENLSDILIKLVKSEFSLEENNEQTNTSISEYSNN